MMEMVKGSHVVLEEERSRHNCRKLGMRVAGELLLPLTPACTMHLLAPAPAPCLLLLAPALLLACTASFLHLHFYDTYHYISI